jgi:hypothetical protein
MKINTNYLKQNGRPILKECLFQYNHSIYRLAENINPVTFAYPSMFSELSSNWSMLAIPGHIKEIKKINGSIVYTSVDAIKKFIIEGNKSDNGENCGIHKINCYLYHSPENEDYSHVQIDIIHQLPENKENRRYNRTNWEDKDFNLLKKNNKFFKNLREEYRFKLALLFNELPLENYLKPSNEFKEYNTSLFPTIVEQIFDFIKIPVSICYKLFKNKKNN